MKKWTPIVIEWDDATSIHEECDSNALAEHLTIQRRTVGFLLRQNKREVVVCMEDDRGKGAGDYDCQTVTAIPRKMVQRLIPLNPEAKPCSTNAPS